MPPIMIALPGALRQARKRGHAWRGLSLLRPALLGLSLLAPLPAPAQPPLDESTTELLVAAVIAATEVDLYNACCRSDQSGRRTDNLNKLLASKFRLTVLKVQDDLFPEKSYRRAQTRLQEEFLARLKAAGGCPGAKEAGMPAELGDRYQALMREIERLP